MASHHTSHAHRVVEELLAECELNFNPGLHLEPHYEQYVRPMKKELHQCSGEFCRRSVFPARQCLSSG